MNHMQTQLHNMAFFDPIINFLDKFKTTVDETISAGTDFLGITGGEEEQPFIGPLPAPPQEQQATVDTVSTPQQLSEDIITQSNATVTLASQFTKEMNESGFFDVFDSSGNKITQEQFQQQGLNIEHIPETFGTPSEEISITDFADVQMEAPPSNIPQVDSSLISSITTFNNMFQTFFEETQAALDELEKTKESKAVATTREDELIKRFEDFFANKPSQAEVFGSALESFGVTPELIRGQIALAKQIGAVAQEMADIQEQKARVLEAEGARPGVQLGFLEGRLAKIEKQFNSRINAKAAQGGALQAQLEAQRGNIDQARALAAQVVAAAVADQQASFDEHSLRS